MALQVIWSILFTSAMLCEQVHDDPVSSPVDGPTQWPLRHFEELLKELIDIAKITKGKQHFNIDLTPYDPDIQ